MSDTFWTEPGRIVGVPLGKPPLVAGLGVGVHGTTRALDVFRLPDLWQLHLYRYSAELTVDGVAHRIRPGRVSLVPPGAVVAFRYEGPSEHLYVHFALPGTGPGVDVPVVQEAGAQTPVLHRGTPRSGPRRGPRACGVRRPARRARCPRARPRRGGGP